MPPDPIEQLAAAIEKLNTTLDKLDSRLDSMKARDGQMAAAFEHLGDSLTRMAGHVESLNEQTAKVLKAAAKRREEQEKAYKEIEGSRGHG